jgi:hypothetical protein
MFTRFPIISRFRPCARTRASHLAIVPTLVPAFVLALILLASLVLPACRPFTTIQPSQSITTQDTSDVLDQQLIGQWTTASKRVGVSITSAGKPVGAVTIGEWYNFRKDGTYYRVARFMTFAIGGVSVEEGRYKTADPGLVEENSLLMLYDRTDSFYPDKGSPQKAKYREPADDQNLYYQIVTRNEGQALALQTAADQQAIDYWRCQD